MWITRLKLQGLSQFTFEYKCWGFGLNFSKAQLCFKNSNNLNILIFPLGLLRKIRFNTHQPSDLYKYLIKFNTGAFAHLRATWDMRTGKSCRESQWEKIWFLSYKAIKSMHLKLHILIFHITYTGCCGEWGRGSWALHVLVDGNKSRWGALAVCSGTVWSSMPAEHWGKIILLNPNPMTTPAFYVIRIPHLWGLLTRKVTGLQLTLMAVMSFAV